MIHPIEGERGHTVFRSTGDIVETMRKEGNATVSDN